MTESRAPYNADQQDADQIIPEDARYGLWNHETKSWEDEWYYGDSEAVDAVEEYSQSGLPFVVKGVNNNTADDWLNEIASAN